MRIENDFEVPAAPSETYALLVDLERIAPCIPGGEVGPREDDGAHPATIAVKLGPMRMTYRGEVRIEERDAAAHRAVLAADVREQRGQGTARATMTMAVAAAAAGSLVETVTDLKLTGRAAQMGRGVVDDVAARLVADPRLPVVSFTGSVPVGWGIRDAVPRKHVALELGGNATAVVCPDWSDLDFAAQRIATFAMYQAGQSCISVQRVYAHADVYPELVDRVLDHVGKLGTGDPRAEATDVGPLIDEAAAQRVEDWVAEAVAAGAGLATGGRRDGVSLD
ncbi:MAG: aldehyde dehydrogenase family protein, partial [Solirubrobacterales bacterium]